MTHDSFESLYVFESIYGGQQHSWPATTYTDVNKARLRRLQRYIETLSLSHTHTHTHKCLVFVQGNENRKRWLGVDQQRSLELKAGAGLGHGVVDEGVV